MKLEITIKQDGEGLITAIEGRGNTTRIEWEMVMHLSKAIEEAVKNFKPEGYKTSGAQCVRHVEYRQAPPEAPGSDEISAKE